MEWTNGGQIGKYSWSESRVATCTEKKVVMKGTHLGFKETKQNTDSSKFKSWFLRKGNHKKRSKWHWEELLLQLVTLEEDTETHLSYQFLTILNSISITLLHMLSIDSHLFLYTNPVVSLYFRSHFHLSNFTWLFRFC